MQIQSISRMPQKSEARAANLWRFISKFAPFLVVIFIKFIFCKITFFFGNDAKNGW